VLRWALWIRNSTHKGAKKNLKGPGTGPVTIWSLQLHADFLTKYEGPTNEPGHRDGPVAGISPRCVYWPIAFVLHQTNNSSESLAYSSLYSGKYRSHASSKLFDDIFVMVVLKSTVQNTCSIFHFYSILKSKKKEHCSHDS